MKILEIAVIGAAGKMGGGISLVLLQEIADSLLEQNEIKKRLILIDISNERLLSLKRYLRIHLTKYAEKKIKSLRHYYKDAPFLVSNEEIIIAFVEEALDWVNYSLAIESASSSQLVFEAIIEDFSVKATLLKKLKEVRKQEQWYFSNTSSIPIRELANAAKLEKNLIGFHFYNPPPVQKLIELVIPVGTFSELEDFALNLAKRLHKEIVRSADVAGFIGNGHFMRELIFACHQVKIIAEREGISSQEALSKVNGVSQCLLLRPMGIFQVAYYVGLDVCHNILQIMNHFLKDPELDPTILKQLMQRVPSKEFSQAANFQSFVEVGSWKQLQKDVNAKEKIESYLRKLFQGSTSEAFLAKTLLSHSLMTGQSLVKQGVATSLKEVDLILTKGFFHLYGLEQIKPLVETCMH